MKNQVVKNKRHDCDSWITVIISVVFAVLAVLGLVLSKSGPVAECLLLFVLSALLLPSSIKEIIKLYRLPKCKAAEIVEKNLIIYGNNPNKGAYVKHQINIRDIEEYKISYVGRARIKYYSCMEIFTDGGHFMIKELDRRTKKPYNRINYNIFKIKRILNRALKINGILQAKLPDKPQNKYARAMFKNYLSDILDAKPQIVRYIVHWFRYNNRRYYIFIFKRNAKDKRYLFGINGGYLDSRTRKDSLSLTEFGLYNKKTVINDAKIMMEKYYNNALVSVIEAHTAPIGHGL